MQKFLRILALAGTLLFGSVSATAAPVMWTLSDIAFDREGFKTNYLTGNFTYDAGTNTFSNVNLTNYLPEACCWTVDIATATSTASSLDFFIIGRGNQAVHLELASPLTDAGGTIALTSGSITGTLRAGQFISAPITAPVPEPASWALMISGFALAGAAMRRQRGMMQATFA